MPSASRTDGRRHNGRVGRRRGSTFTCTIPAQVAGLSPAATDSDRILSGAQVLLVSDRALCAEAIGRHLSDWGAEVVTAQSIDAAVAGEWPRAALAIIDANEPAALIRDIARLTAAAANPELPIVCVATTACRAALARAGELRPSVRTPVRRDHLRKQRSLPLAIAGSPRRQLAPRRRDSRTAPVPTTAAESLPETSARTRQTQDSHQRCRHLPGTCSTWTTTHC